MLGPLVLSWGRVARVEQELLDLHDRSSLLPRPRRARESLLPFGNGRSYGDSCLNEGGTLLRTRHLDRFIAFDPVTGLLRCESGVLLSEILQLVLPRGWFLPVTPGTKFVTMGGAIANDVHGKNHHVAGCFGAHVRRMELLRSDGSREILARDRNPERFAATVGGLGLTGLITWAEIQLRRIDNPWMEGETIRFRDVGEFLSLSAETARDREYSVAWIDCAARDSRLGRGLFMAANHAAPGTAAPARRGRAWTFPFVPPVSLVNPLSLRAFNFLYYHMRRRERVRAVQHHEPFFYPLDGIREWNRMYGPHGFYQYQSVVPAAGGAAAVRAQLDEIGRSGLGSFLAVLKVFGDAPAEGMLSFPMPGITLALDFPNVGERLHRLFARLDAVVAEAGGRLYPAKDGRMPGALFRTTHSRLREFAAHVDPCFSSSFWRRVMEQR